MNELVEFLKKSYSGTIEEVRESEKYLLRREPEREFYLNLFYLAENYEDFNVRISAIIRLIQLLKNNWKEYFTNEIKSIFFEHFVILINSFPSSFEDLMIKFSDYMIEIYFNKEWDIFENAMSLNNIKSDNDIRKILILSLSIFKHFKYAIKEEEEEFYSNFLLLYLDFFSQYFINEYNNRGNLYLILRSFKYICACRIPLILKRDSEIFQVLFEKINYLGIDEKYCYLILKLFNALFKNRFDSFSDKFILSFFNFIINLFLQEISIRIYHVIYKLLLKLFHYNIIITVIFQENLELFFQKFFFSFLIFKEQDKKFSLENPLEFIFNNFSKISTDFFDKKSIICNLIIDLNQSSNIFHIFIQKNLINICFRFINHRNYLIRSLVFYLLSLINFESFPDFLVLQTFESLKDSIFLVRFFASQELSIILRETQNKNEIINLCFPHLDLLFNTLFESFYYCFESRLISILYIYIESFKDYINPYLDKILQLLFSFFNDFATKIHYEYLEGIKESICFLFKTKIKVIDYLYYIDWIMNNFSEYLPIPQIYAIDILNEIIKNVDFEISFWNIFETIPMYVAIHNNESYQEEVNLLTTILIKAKAKNVFNYQSINIIFERTIKVFENDEIYDYKIGLEMLGVIFNSFIEKDTLNPYIKIVFKIIDKCINFQEIYSELSFLISSLFLYDSKFIQQ